LPNRDHWAARRTAPAGADAKQPAGGADGDRARLCGADGDRARLCGADRTAPDGAASGSPTPYNDAGVFTQMYSVTSLLGLATRWGVELAKKIESPGSRK
jgi:hypothetical protein